MPSSVGAVAPQLEVDPGFSLSDIVQPVATPRHAESVARYGPGYERQAQAVAASLGGEVAIGQSPIPSGAKVILVTGTNMAVASPPPTPSLQAQTALPSFDPGACPPGAVAVPAQG